MRNVTALRLPLLAPLLATLALSAGCSRSASQFVESGNRYVAQQKYREAVIEYRNAIQQDPRLGDARFRLAETLLHLGDAQGAAGEYIRAADLMPQNVQAQLKAGTARLLGGQYSEARACADRLLAREPNNVDGQILLANAMAGLKDLDGAVSQLQEAIELNPSAGHIYASLGALQMARGGVAEAEVAFHRAVEIDPKSVPARLALANFYWASGKVPETESALKQAVSIDPTNVLANRALATYYVAARRPAEAEAPLKTMVGATKEPWAAFTLADYYTGVGRTGDALATLRPLSTERGTATAANIRIAAIQHLQRNPAEAHKTIDTIIAAEPRNAAAILTKARFLLAEQKVDEALARAKAAAAADPRSTAAQFLLGQLLSIKNDADAAIAAYGEVIRLSPNAVPAQLELARMQLQRGSADAALQHAEAAAQIEPNNPIVRLSVTRMLMAKGELDRADSELNGLLATYPDAPAVLAQAGTARLLRRDLMGARGYFDRVVALEPANYEALTGLVTLDLAAKQPGAARTRLDAAIARAPNDARLLLLSARIDASSGAADRAERSLLQAIQLDPSSLGAYSHLGQIYIGQKRLDEAAAQFEQMASKQPRPVAPVTMVGIIREMQGRADDAQKAYERVVAVDPRAPVASNNLAWLMAERGGNLDIALQHAQAAKQGLPDQPEVNDTLGWIYLKKGLAALAIPPLHEAVDKAPANPTYHYHLGLAQLKNGDTVHARTSLSQALKLNPSFAGAEDARKALAGIGQL